MQRHSKFTTCLLLILALVVTSACTARHIRDAQDVFNRAASEENRLFAAGLSTDAGLVSESSAATDYLIALSLLEKELGDNEAKLRAERLYGTAMMLKALCLWRLADLSELGEGDLTTMKSAGELVAAETEPGKDDKLRATLGKLEDAVAKEGSTVLLGERDRALLTALPGLRDHDRGLRAADYDTAERYFESALGVLDTAVKGTPAQHPVRTYLLLAELSTCRAWQSAAYSFLPTNAADKKAIVPVNKAKEIFKVLDKRAERDGTLKAQVTMLKQRLGL